MAGPKIAPSRKRFLSIAGILFLWVPALILLYRRQSIHAQMAAELITLLSLSLSVEFLEQVPLRPFSAMALWPMLIFQSLTTYYLGSHTPAMVLFLLIDTALLLIWQTGHIRPFFLGLAITALASAFLFFAYTWFFRKLMPIYYKISHALNLKTLSKSLLLLTAGLLFLSLCCLTVKLAARFLTGWQERFLQISRRFIGLELFFLIFVILSLFLWYILDYCSLLVKRLEEWSAFLTILPLLFLLMEAAYLFLFLKTISIREKMSMAENDKNLLSAYNAELEDTMDSMHEIRHDAKNLLLTMGGFVEQSSDVQMKEFYQKNIVPFMENVLTRYELQNKLKLLGDDCLKSFLYYKIMEKNEKGIPISLKISTAVISDINYGDLIRLLGILLDNAAEEAALAAGSVRVSISQEEHGLRFRIANDIRPESRIRGVIPGTTDKGLGRGNGLLIARKIIARYDNLLLNSYFTESDFVQSLLIAGAASPRSGR